MEVKGIGWEGVAWNYLDQENKHWKAFVHMELNLQVPYEATLLTS
jgi:hypothetical protein